MARGLCPLTPGEITLPRAVPPRVRNYPNDRAATIGAVECFAPMFVFLMGYI